MYSEIFLKVDPVDAKYVVYFTETSIRRVKLKIRSSVSSVTLNCVLFSHFEKSSKLLIIIKIRVR